MATFTSEQVRRIKTAIMQELDLIKDEYNIEIDGGNVVWSPNEFHFSMSVKTLDENGEPAADKQHFDIQASIVGFLGHYNDHYVHNGMTYYVKGINTRRPKNPMELQDKNGKDFKASANYVNMMLNLKK